MKKFNRRLSLSIDTLHQAIDEAMNEPNQFKRLRKMFRLRAKLRELEKRVKA
jgi:hypothetical protein